MASILPSLGNASLLVFGFRHPLSKRETSDLVALSSKLGDFVISVSSRDSPSVT